MRAWWTSAAVGAVTVGTAVAGFSQTTRGENTIASHVAAARAAADDTWILFSELCGGATALAANANGARRLPRTMPR